MTLISDLRRTASLLYLDSVEVFRPPGFDAMLLLISALGAALVVLQPVTSPVAAVRSALEPTLIAATLFLALRGAAGITGLIQEGVMNVYLSYPISRRWVALSIYASRVVMPSIILLSGPIAIVMVILWPVITRDLYGLAGMYTAYLIQAVFYGTLFALVAVNAKTPGTSGVISVTIYFVYNVASIILAVIGASTGSQLIIDLASSMLLYIAVYNYFTGVDVGPEQLVLVPAATLILFAAFIIYLSRRFEL